MVTLRLSELQTLRRGLARKAAQTGTSHAILDKHLDVQGSDPIHSGAWGTSPIEDYFEDRLVRDQKNENLDERLARTQDGDDWQPPHRPRLARRLGLSL